MKQLDWVGEPEQKKRARIEIPNQRAAVAEEKAILCRKIHKACAVIPRAVVGGSVDSVRAWKAQVDASMKTAAIQRSSVPELKGALDRIMAHLSADEAQKVIA